ncbi:MAG: NAD(P)-dependent oxidoreductase [Nitrospirae bacterium]|nr:NAD(P)-dependent oxidoreductase [Nitrospirota bacterium]MBF0592443.1 NAD(P)-dependent oxidoreductase [Nitrospirota bacterium]
MKVIVTGGTGFIGSHLVEELVLRGYSVTCLVRSTSNLQWIEGFPVCMVQGDCLKVETLKDLLIDCDYVFHLAGLTRANKTDDFYCTNASGTENLVEAVFKYVSGIKRFVHVSTLAVAGPSNDGVPLNVDALPAPVSDYGKSKLAGEMAVQAYKDRLPITIIRPPAVYGPRDRDMFVIFKMIRQGIFPYWGKSYYSLIYVEDLVKGIVSTIETDKTIGGTYYLSDLDIHTNEDIADAIAEELGCRYVKIKIPKGVMPVVAAIACKLMNKGIINPDKIKELTHPYWLCNSEEAARDFGFEPKTKLKDGIRWTANWYKIHKWL